MKKQGVSVFLARRLRSISLAVFLISSLISGSYYIISPPSVHGISTGIVISQVYGGGGNSGATYKNDFIELFNRGNTTINVTGWSVQYASSTGTSWAVTALSGSIAPGHYYLVQEAVGAGGTVNLPTPDATGSIAMSATAGKVALVNNSTALSGSCPSVASIVDLVGYDGANCFEGSGAAPALTNTTAALRSNNGCADTDNNAADFTAVAPNPRNSTSPALACDTPTNPTGVGAATPNTVTPGGSSLLTVTVTPGTMPTSTGLAVTGDLSPIGGSANQQFFNDGTNGDAAANDSVFSFQATVSGGTTVGAKSLAVSITDAQSRAGATAVSLTVQSPTVPAGSVVISQVYGGGGNSGATFRNDFVELFNRTGSVINITGWSVQYSSPGGASWQVTTLSGSIAPGRYYLVQEAAGSGGTVDLPTPDAPGGIAMSATAGKVALVSNSSPLSGACPTGASIIDFVGYGSGATCFEGGSPTTTLSNTTAALRAFDGCIDTDNNTTDFSAHAPNPHNSASPFNDCNAPVPTYSIPEIQGGGATSPHVGEVVATTFSIVTGLKSNGFYIQTPAGAEDNDPGTSEGVFVFTGSPRPATPVIGDGVTVKARVVEFIPSADPHSPSLTELSNPTVAILSSGNPLPAPVTITAADTLINDLNNLEKYEGMRVHVDTLTVVAPTQAFSRTTSEEAANASAPNGVFYGVIAGIARPFREPGVRVLDELPAGSPCCVPRFDDNPERLRVDSRAQPGTTSLEVTSGATVTNLTGPLDYSFRTYTILPDAATAPVASGNITAIAVPAPAPGEFTVASFNMERFYDTSDDPATQDVVMTATAFNNRLNKASLAIREVMRSPDIIGVVEMENLTALQAVASKVNGDAVAAGQPNPNYQAYLEEGNDIGGIDVGFLVKGARVTVNEVTQVGKDTTFVTPGGDTALLNDRPSLVMRGTITTPANGAFPVTVIVNHLRSLSGVDGSDGARIRAKRRAQAEFLANFIQSIQANNPDERIISVGDYNAFQFNDGYVDSLGTIKGTPTPADAVLLASSDLVTPDLVELTSESPNQQYSFVFDGNAQELDHILITQSLQPLVNGLQYARSNSDFPESYRAAANRPERLSDHDMPVAYFRFPTETTTTVDNAMATYNDGAQTITLSATVTATGSTVNEGTVTFQVKDGTTNVGSAVISSTLTGGAASVTYSLPGGLAAKQYTIDASYGGGNSFSSSVGIGTLTVEKASTVTQVSSSPNPSTYGQAVTFTATVISGSGTPTGSVSFFDGATLLGSQPLGGGSASLTTAALAAGNHSITAVYAQGANFLGSTSAALTHTVNKASTATSVQAAVSGKNVILTATVSAIAPGAGVPVGGVEFFNGPVSLGVAPLSGGTATLSVPKRAYLITAVYNETANFKGSMSDPLPFAPGK
ncbi:MAG TPA: Ig-like domain repeat protein [Blastocatellia bacterium]|nr:Ig-like domain repeat protein [Blastocatellia bacterium]